jgi:hypothetical protein
LLAAVFTLGIGFSSVRLGLVAGPPGGLAFIGGNSDRVGDESASQKAGGSRASGVACSARTSNDRAKVSGAEESYARKMAMCAARHFAGEAKFERLASSSEDWRGYENQLGQFPNFGRCRSTGTRVSQRLATQAQFVQSEMHFRCPNRSPLFLAL